ncbi:MAG TPA: PAS domain S-box protein, partial [Thermoanaerobaculia bacterium]|nr:PAS domain S-box protein [Thermoanaerobaculia bacterium]
MSRKVLSSPPLMVRRRRATPVALRPPGKAVAAIARELLDVLEAPALLVDGAFEIRGSNSAFEKTHGVSGRAARLVEESGVRPDLRAVVREALRLGGEARSDVSTGDGSLLLRARPIRPAGEELVVVTVEDVAETVRTSEETRQLREICARLLDSSVDGIFAFDRDLRFTIWNRSMERISGVTAVEALGRSALLVIPDFMRSGAEAHFRQALEGKAVFTKTTPFRRLEPGRAVVSEGFYAPLHAGDESISGALGIIRDVTGAVRTEEALKDSEERYWKLLEDSLTGNFVATAEGHIVACNAAFVR